MTDLKNLIPLNEIKLRENHIPIKVTTLYKWRHQKKYPTIFVKIGKKVFIDIIQFKKTFLENQEA